jgi:hypothetical protein
MLLFYQVATRLSLTTCWQIVELQDGNKLSEQLVTSLLSSTILPKGNCQQAENKHSKNIPVDKLLAQHCYKSASGLLQLVRFYVCTSGCYLTLIGRGFECAYKNQQSAYKNQRVGKQPKIPGKEGVSNWDLKLIDTTREISGSVKWLMHKSHHCKTKMSCMSSEWS